MNMKNNKSNIIVVVIMATVTIITGCDFGSTSDKSQFSRTYFPTNHWRVVGQGTNGQVVVETTSTNLAEHFRVHAAEAVTPLSNGQPVRVEMTVRWNPSKGWVELISSKAYPAME